MCILVSEGKMCDTSSITYVSTNIKEERTDEETAQCDVAEDDVKEDVDAAAGGGVEDDIIKEETVLEVKLEETQAVIREVVLGAGGKHYACALCDETFTDCSGLSRHVGVVHADAESCTCGHCNEGKTCNKTHEQ